MSQANQIAFVRKGSVAAENGIEPLDIIESINNVKLEDIFDYYYYEDEPEFDMVILKPNGDRFNLHIVKGRVKTWGFHLKMVLWMNTDLVITSASSVLLIRCLRICERLYTSRMMIPDCLSFRVIM